MNISWSGVNHLQLYCSSNLALPRIHWKYLATVVGTNLNVPFIYTNTFFYGRSLPPVALSIRKVGP